MKILLIYPPILRSVNVFSATMPLGLLQVAGYLREMGNDVNVLNLEIGGKIKTTSVNTIRKAYQENSPVDFLANERSSYRVQYREMLKRLKPDLVGFSCSTESKDAVAYLTQDTLKLFPDMRIEYGGICGIASEWSRFVTKESLYFDPAMDLLDGQNPPFSFGSVITSLGCPHNCTFCGSPQQYKRKMTEISIEKIKKRIDNAIIHGATNIVFVDDTLTINEKRAFEIADIMYSTKVTWKCHSRIDSLFRNHKIIKYFKEHGCTQIMFGVESGSPRIIKKMKKGIELENVLEVVDLLNREKLPYSAYFMIGYPGETDEDVKMSIELMKKMNPQRISGYSVVPYHNTELHASNPDFVNAALAWPFCRWSPSDPGFLCDIAGNRVQGPSAKAVNEFYDLIETINDHEPTPGTFSVTIVNR